jgi:hypothetical protein
MTDQQVREQVREQVQQTAQVAGQKARGATEQARSRLRDQVDLRSTQAGERLGATAGDVRSVADELRRQDKETPARIAEQVADRADRLGDYLKSASGDRILRDVENFTRSNPWLVAGGGLVLGFAASRFLKASSSRRYRSTTAPSTAPSPRLSQPPATEPPTSGVDAGLDPIYGAPVATEPGYVTPPVAPPPVPPVDPVDPYRRQP